jgi:hypothetical protein
VPQALEAYERLLEDDPSAAVALQIGDLGHAPGANHPNDVRAFSEQGAAFLEAWILGKGTRPAPGAVTAYTMTCPKEAPSGGGPFTASNYGSLARRSFRISTRSRMTITSRGGDRQLAADLSPAGGKGADQCSQHKEDRRNRAKVSVRSPGFTMIGQPVITGRAVANGRYAGLIARMWDYDPATRTQRLITRGVYRLKPGAQRFELALDGNGWRFQRGHRIVFELLGRDAPTYLPSPNSFTAKLSGLRFKIPYR